ncbi:nucleotide-binding domain-containing protein [Oribacterium sinus]|uniref:nucleotide-binding domain-containing protein n=1 Tax=Oribacterium sinus TaxID=237576 RepID=UPI0028F0DE96|nr:nucleotidyltransferase domain-containing protein [Oribacterium sinus]
MGLLNDFDTFCSNIKLDNLADMKKTTEEIAKKLNTSYYDLDNETELHMYIVGSVGRNTAISGSSDLDILFDLPVNVYRQYNAFSYNGQSALVQAVKKVLKEKYTSTNIRGDGQVVVIAFDKYTIELVPGFKQVDNRFKYPDTHDGGSWKYTDPLSEQSACADCETKSEGKYFDFCHIIRSWKNNIGFKMGGLLIDTLVYDFFDINECFAGSPQKNYLEILQALFEYLKNQDKDRSHWYAMGSHQRVYNSEKGKYIGKAKEAYDKIKDLTIGSDNANKILRQVLGNSFPKVQGKTERSAQYVHIKECYDCDSASEEFIEEKFFVDIRYDVDIDCNVTQAGWRPFLLRKFLGEGSTYLRKNKKLAFFIEGTDCPKPYDVYWKVRNVGAEAIRRDMVRGNIVKESGLHHIENTVFEGEHYVECFLVKNNVCVARDRIEVPIGTL